MLKSLSFTLFLFISATVLAQEKFTLSGNIKDASDGEDLVGVTILVKELPGVGTVANLYGFYSITLPKGKYTIQYKYLGYKTIAFVADLSKNIKNNIQLVSGSTDLNVVEIIAEKENQNIRSNEMSVEKISIKDVSSIPVLFGENDVMKVLQLLPGVKSAGEGSSGFFVRGGNSDQNLILLDEAPVYNASHLLGFFSVFNPDAIKDLTLYKGGIPAQFAGRLSSVVDIKMKEGNSKKFKAIGGVGILSSRLTLEGPIVKDKSSFIISGRRTYFDMFLKLSNNEDIKNTILYFYDLNLKANYQFSDKNRLFISGYFGRDNFGFANRFNFNYGNATATVRWNHLYNDKLFSNTSFIYSYYNYKIDIIAAGFSINSQIQDFTLKQDVDFFWNGNNKLKFGASAIHHTFYPGEISSTGESVGDSKIENRYGIESGLYVSNEQKFNESWSATYGVRYSNFTQIGPGEFYTYNTQGKATDTTVYKENNVVVTYHGIEPRLSLNYVLNESTSIKTSYNRMYQYLHLLSNSSGGNPTDTWLSSSNNVKPEIADQVALGYFKNFKNNTYEFSVETYYKAMQNTIDYRTGAEITLNPKVEGELLYGKGRAYGLEFYLKRKKGVFTGWISYTLARTEVQYDKINKGAWYPAKQDRTHDLSFVAMYDISERLKISSTFVFYTGNAVTFPTGKYVIDGQTINLYSDRNGSRFPNYHRLDLGLTLEGKNYKMVTNPETGLKEKKDRRIHSSWNFSIYNVYARENPYSYSFRENEENPIITEAVQLSLFKYPLPAITYNFNF
ncbi:MAG: TonB-dependent receptor [Bacteroidetes bacterium]|nr:TonB-dependent receptor [Bacteroidota bacterium]